MQQSKRQRITLKQYIHSNSLRKKAISRANSRQSQLQSQSGNPSRCTSFSFPTKKTETKQDIVRQLKMKLAEYISHNQKLVFILKMIQKVEYIHNQQIKQLQKEIEVLSSLVQEHKKIDDQKLKLTSMKQSRILIQDNLPQTNSQSSISFHPTHVQKQNLLNSYKAKKINWLEQSQYTSQQNDDISQINLLLPTRTKNQQQVEGESKEAYHNQNVIPLQHNQSIIESFGIDKSNSVRKRRLSNYSNFSNQLDPSKVLNQEQQSSQIRFSIRSSLWNNNFEGISLGKSFQPKKNEF